VPMRKRHTLDVIDVRTPCPADWEEMAGDDAKRFCQHCQKHVHNLSAMPADEAERLVCESGGRLCVRFARDGAGKVLTLDYRGTTRRRWTWRVWTLIALVGAVVTASVQAVIFGRRELPRGPTVVVGMIPPQRIVPSGTIPGAGAVPGAEDVWMGDAALPVEKPPPAGGGQPSNQVIAE
jgi:hypothetical protein